MKAEYQRISVRSKKLLYGSENVDVDFKVSTNNVGSEDFVAFANSPNGGVLLFGVNEVKSKDKKQFGSILGCPPTDENKLKILNKALSCVPQIDVVIIFENLSVQPFIRVEIPSGRNKPYCTNKGIYCIRENGRNRALLPTDLLQLFLDNESGKFLSRFSSVTTKLDENINKLDETVDNTTKQIIQKFQNTSNELLSNLNDVYLRISEVEGNIEATLDSIHNTSDESVTMSDYLLNITDETLSGINQVDEKINNLSFEIKDILDSSTLLLDKFNIEYPHIVRRRKKIEDVLKILLAKKPKLTFKSFLKDLENIFLIVPNGDFLETCRETYKKIKKEMKNPQSEVSKLIKQGGQIMRVNSK